MPVYGKTPMGEANGTSLGLGFVRLATNGQGAVTTREYWNHAVADWEAAPRVDAKHVLPHQRLSSDESDVDNGVQIATVPQKVMDSANVVAVTYNIDQTGKAVGVYRVDERNIVMAVASINPIY